MNCTFTRHGVTCGMPVRLVIAGPLATQVVDGKGPCHDVQQDARWHDWIARGLPDHDAVVAR